MFVLERCPSYRKSNKGSKERQGPTLSVRFTEVSVKRESTVYAYEETNNEPDYDYGRYEMCKSSGVSVSQSSLTPLSHFLSHGTLCMVQFDLILSPPGDPRDNSSPLDPGVGNRELLEAVLSRG